MKYIIIKLLVWIVQFRKVFLSSSGYFSIKIKAGPLKGYKWLMSRHSSNEYIIGIYEIEVTKLLSIYIRSGDVVYDLGAHHGYFSLLSSRLVGENGFVYSFEPIPSNFAILDKIIKLNKRNTVKLFKIAISNYNGIIKFSSSINSVANTYKETSSVFKESPKIEVTTSTLDELYKKQEISKPNFLKIDVEGAEDDVLQGAITLLSQCNAVILVATHNSHNPGVEERVKKILIELNYKVEKEIHHPNDSNLKDILFIKNEA